MVTFRILSFQQRSFCKSNKNSRSQLAASRLLFKNVPKILTLIEFSNPYVSILSKQFSRPSFFYPFLIISIHTFPDSIFSKHSFTFMSCNVFLWFSVSLSVCVPVSICVCDCMCV